MELWGGEVRIKNKGLESDGSGMLFKLKSQGEDVSKYVTLEQIPE